MATIKVFISSRRDELIRERAAAQMAIESLGMMPVRFEVAPAEPDEPREVVLREVRDSEIFIQILGRTLSAAVMEEYESALNASPHSIIVFIKSGPKEPDMENHIRRVRRRHKYKEFVAAEDLEREVRAALHSLMAETLRHAAGKAAKLDLRHETIVDDSFSLKNSNPLWFEIDVAPGDRIKGLARGSDNFDFLLLDEVQFAAWIADREFEPLGGGFDRNSHAFDVVAKKLDFWYASLYTGAWFDPVEIHVTIRRLPA